MTGSETYQVARTRTRWNLLHTRQIERVGSKVLDLRTRFHLRTVHP